MLPNGEINERNFSYSEVQVMSTTYYMVKNKQNK